MIEGRVKTIFIAVFEGVEAKNVLRTAVLSTLLSDPSVYVRLFTKSHERVTYYRHEFPDKRISFEVVGRPNSRGLDKIFARLKFTLLRTKTTDLKRRMAYQESGNLAAFALSFLASRIFARPIVRRFVRFLDFILVRDDTYDAYFKNYRPALVFLPHLFDEPEIGMLRAAKKFRVRSVGFVNSWDKATARATMRLLPDKLIAFNDVVKREVIVHDEMKPEDVFVGGLPQYDIYLSHQPVSREKFFARYGFNPRKRLIVYAPMGAAFSDVDWQMMDIIRWLITEGKIKNAEFLVRFQPNDFLDEAEIKKRPNLKYDYPGRRFGGKRGIDWDMDEKDLKHLVDTLYHVSLIISYASSICIDALAFDRPSLNINFEPLGKRTIRKSPTQYYHTEHYENVLKTDGVTLASSEEDLVAKANMLLDNTKSGADGRSRLKAEQWHFTDGRSGERIGNFLLAQCKQL